MVAVMMMVGHVEALDVLDDVAELRAGRVHAGRRDRRSDRATNARVVVVDAAAVLLLQGVHVVGEVGRWLVGTYFIFRVREILYIP